MLTRIISTISALTLVLALAAAHANAQDKDAFAAPGGSGSDQPRPEVVPGVTLDREAVEPGGQLVVAVTLDHAKGWHTQVRAEDLTLDTLYPTTVDISNGEHVSVGPTQWPESKPFEIDLGEGPVEVPVYSGEAHFFVPILISSDAEPGETIELTIDVGWQVCDDFTCLPPDGETFTRSIDVAPVGSEEAAPAGTGIFSGFDPTTFANASEWSDAAPAQSQRSAGTGGSEFFGVRIPPATSPLGIAIVSLLAIVGGLILNLTPCVLPVIPIKVMTISSHAGSPGKSTILGLWMAAGVVAFWVAIGLPVAFLTGFTDPSRLFGIWWVTLGIGLLIALMGVGIMGAFSINLPDKAYMINPKADSPGGSFAFGVMTAILGLPCFGFVAGALLAGSAALPPAVIITIFAALGVGMALPYLVLSMNPKWVDKIPRTGPASELVKQVMGLLLLSAAAYFIGSGVLALISAPDLPWWAKVVHWWGVALFALAAGGWLIAKTVKITPSTGMRTAMAVVGLILAGGGVAAAADQTTKARTDFWVPYTEETLNQQIDAGKVVVLDFTAEWCLNCKTLESTVLARKPVKPELLSDGVVPLKADLTSNSAPGWDKLKELGQTGIPTLAIFGPGLEEPWIANAYTGSQVAGAIARARGQAAQVAASEG